MKEGLNDFAQCSLVNGLIGDVSFWETGVFIFAFVNLLEQHSSASKVIRLYRLQGHKMPLFYVNLGYKVAQGTYNC